MTHRDVQASLICQLLQLQLPEPYPGAVAPARVSGNQQALGSAIDGFAHRTPPSPDALDGEGGRVVVNTHAHPASILAHVVDAIRSDPSQLGNDEVMYPHLLRVSLEPKLSAPVFEVPHQLLLLGIHRDDRLTLPQEASDLAVDMLKLSIAIRMRRAFQSLGVCLQAIAQLVQQLGHQTVADAVTTTAQFLGQFAHAFASPA